MMNNICDSLNDEQLDRLGSHLKEQVSDDIRSRQEWLDNNDTWMKLVTQVIEKKTYPWPDASNIKFPLISTAAVQFHARAFPALLGNNKPVKARVLGYDPKGLKRERGDRVSTYMSYQVTEGMDNWVDDMDRLLMILPIIGSLYKKTYFSEVKGSTVSEMIHPRDLIINYDANEIKNCRKTHRLWKYPNTIKEMQNRELYREFDGDDNFDPPKQHSEPRDETQGLTNPGKHDDFALQEIYEVHCLIDLDNDGYKEPYIATIRAKDGKFYRLVANYDDDSIETNGEKVVAIEPKEYFTHYKFIPDPESKTHGLGFGTMVGPINEAVNTIINILTDAGHMHSLGGGFLSRGVRMRGGAVKFKPSEWKSINTTGDDLRKGVYPLPTKEPSTVLFQMLGLLIDSGKDLSSVQDLMVGRNPGQNQPYSTTQAVMEQGMKVFNGIYKRIYRSMTEEFQLLYHLNAEFPNIDEYAKVLDWDGANIQEAAKAPSMETGQPFGMDGVMAFLGKDFQDEDLDIKPTAEPDMVMEMQKILRANSLIEKRAQGIPLNVQEVTRRVLEAEGHENIGILMQVQQPPTPPDVQLEQAKFEHQKQMDGLQTRLEQIKTMAEVGKIEMEAKLALAKANNEATEGLHAQFIEQQKQIRDEFDAVTKRLKVLLDGRKTEQSREETSGSSGESK